MLLHYLVATLHVIVCIILILVVLLQSGKGADLAGAFGGGGSQTAFGSRGPASFLTRMTTVAAIIFMITSLSLSRMYTKQEASSVLDKTNSTAKPATKAPAPVQPQTPAPSPDQIKRMQQEIEAKQKQQQAQPASPASTQSVPAPAPANSAQQGQSKPQSTGKESGKAQPGGENKPPSK